MVSYSQDALPLLCEGCDAAKQAECDHERSTDRLQDGTGQQRRHAVELLEHLRLRSEAEYQAADDHHRYSCALHTRTQRTMLTTCTMCTTCIDYLHKTCKMWIDYCIRCGLCRTWRTWRIGVNRNRGNKENISVGEERDMEILRVE